MRLGFRASVFLGAAGAAALAVLLAALFNSWIVALAAGFSAAAAAAAFIARELDSRIAGIESAAGHSAQQLSRQIADLTADQARTDALLAGMVEGVLAVDAQGRLELINDAARRMLNLQNVPLGRHYMEAVRHPLVSQQLSEALRNGRPHPVEFPIANRDLQRAGHAFQRHRRCRAGASRDHRAAARRPRAAAISSPTCRTSFGRR